MELSWNGRLTLRLFEEIEKGYSGDKPHEESVITGYY